MKIQILGTGCAKCRKLYELADAAARDSGRDYTIEKVEDLTAIMDLGVMMPPALAVDGEVKVEGKVPGANELERILAAG